MAASRTFLQDAGDASDLTTYTFASQDLGTADAGRYIVAIVHARVASGTLTLSSASIAGVSATIALQETNSSATAKSVCALVIAAVPTGTTGDVVVTFSTGALRAAIQLYRVLGIDGLTASDTATSTDSSPVGSMDIPAGGIAFAGVNNGSSSTSFAWSNLTEDVDTTLEAFGYSSASDEFATLQTARTITATRTGTIGSPVGVFASWAPAAVGGSALPVFINHYRQQGIM
jgi:hypothetical protein